MCPMCLSVLKIDTDVSECKSISFLTFQFLSPSILQSFSLFLMFMSNVVPVGKVLENIFCFVDK